MAVAANGSRYNLASGGRYNGPQLVEPYQLGMGEPVVFDGLFVPADTWAQDWLIADQPVLLVIDDLSETSPLDSVVAIGQLGGGFEGSLYPGNYVLGAFVFSDDNPEAWEDISGGALVEFSVVPGEPPFSLTIPIEAIEGQPDIQPPNEALLLGSGYLSRGEEAMYEVGLESDVTYAVYVEPADPTADLDLYLYDEYGNLIDYDDDATSDAISYVTPRWVGSFRFVVRCHEGESAYRLLINA